MPSSTVRWRHVQAIIMSSCLQTASCVRRISGVPLRLNATSVVIFKPRDEGGGGRGSRPGRTRFRKDVCGSFASSASAGTRALCLANDPRFGPRAAAERGGESARAPVCSRGSLLPLTKPSILRAPLPSGHSRVREDKHRNAGIHGRAGQPEMVRASSNNGEKGQSAGTPAG